MRTLALIACISTVLVAEEPTLRLRDAEGHLVASLIPRFDGFQIVTEDGTVLGETRAYSDRVRVVNERGEELLSIASQRFGAEVRDASGTLEYSLRQEGNEWRVLDASGSEVGRFRPFENGFELRTANNELRARIVAREDRVRFEDASGGLTSELQGTIETRAWGWLALEGPSVAERAAIVTWFLKVAK